MHRIPLLLALVACSQTVPQKPAPKTSRGLHADEHLDAAREHARRADELSRWPETRRNDTGRFDDPNTGIWYRAWDQAEEHQRLAAVHHSEAGRLQAAFDEACANVAQEHIRVSPLAVHAIGGMPTEDGVVVLLGTDAGPAERLVAELRCHQAWMMLSSTAESDLDPLDLPGLRIQAHGDKTGISVVLRIQDKALVPELQRRAAHDVELATRSHPAL